MKEINLNHAISGHYKLSEEDLDSLMQLLTSRCNARTKYSVRAALRNIQQEKHYGIYDRVIKEPKIGRWQYIAGQSCQDEMRTVRKLLRGW